MGWSSIYTGRLASLDKKQRIDKVRTWNNEEIVKSCMVGTTYYAAVRRKDDGVVYGYSIISHGTAQMTIMNTYK